MTEKVRQILELLRRERLNWEEVQALLVALEPRLSLSDSQRDLVNSLLAKADLPTIQIAGHLLVMCGANSAALAEVPPMPPTPAPAPAVSVPFIEQAPAVYLAPPTQVATPVEAVPRVLNVTLLADGAVIHQVNVPLGLLPQLEKLLPARGKQVLEASGFGVDTIAMLVEGGAPIGDLFSTQDEAGAVLQFALK